MSGASSATLRTALTRRALVADGAMGTMLQAADTSPEDFQGHEGCNEILNITRPDIVGAIHRAYFEVGVDAVETNTFGANWANLAEYGIEDRIYELSLAGARIAVAVAEEVSTPEHPRWVFGSIGPGTKLPSMGHVDFARLRDAYQEQCRGLLDGGVHALLIETAQDLLQAKAAVIGARRAMADAEIDAVLMVQVTVETTGTMLLGTEITAALTALEPLGIDVIGLNCATGPAEMSEHLRSLTKHSRLHVSVMPNAGLPELTSLGAQYPLTPRELADALSGFVSEFGVNLVGGCCGTTPEHMRVVVDTVSQQQPRERTPQPEPGVSSLYQHVPFRQDQTFLAIGERTNANGSRAFRDAMLNNDWDACIEIARAQIRDGAHLLDLCVDYVGRDGVSDMRELGRRLATASTLPIMIDSTEPEVVEAGLELFGGRCIVNSVNFEDGDGPDSRIAKIMPVVMEHGAAVVALTIDEQGQARTAVEKFAIADRLIRYLVDTWGMRVEDILIDPLTFPIATGQEETRRDGIETLQALRDIKAQYPSVQSVLGISNVSFGLNPAARQVLNSVFLADAIEAGLDSAIAHASKILPLARISPEQRNIASDLIHDRRAPEVDPLTKLLEHFSGEIAVDNAIDRAAQLAAMPLDRRLRQRIIDGERKDLEQDLEEAMADGIEPLKIINEFLLDGMKEVGELFGRGEMQLPFVLQSAEVMKRSVAYLEPHMERLDDSSRGTIVLATVRGDVHDIGKNLVDIILSNNGFTVVNLGIKQPISTIIEAAEHHDADAIGMSGLLVKSTVIMRENLEEIAQRGLADRWPVILGGAALTRAFVEQDLSDRFAGEVRYARDAFEGLSLMNAIMAVKRGDEGAALPALRPRRVRTPSTSLLVENAPGGFGRSDVSTTHDVPVPPFWGPRVVKGVALADYAGLLDERALFMGQWGLKSIRGGATYEDLVESEGRPRLRALLDEIQVNGWLEAAVVYGYFPCFSDGDDLVIAHHEPEMFGQERFRLRFPRQSRDRRLCISDFFRPREAGEFDVVAFHVVTMGNRISVAANELFQSDRYREYLEIHGLSVQLTEALAEFWHGRIREELGFGMEDSTDVAEILDQGYRGSRYSFGYPACPDLEMQVPLCELLDTSRIGVELSEEFQLHPEQSTSAIIVHHPEAKYFNAT
jgi:5-methyltetrahydrofolate--homocysteine methyltransferase